MEQFDSSDISEMLEPKRLALPLRSLSSTLKYRSRNQRKAQSSIPQISDVLNPTLIPLQFYNY